MGEITFNSYTPTLKSLSGGFKAYGLVDRQETNIYAFDIIFIYSHPGKEITSIAFLIDTSYGIGNCYWVMQNEEHVKRSK